jgi:hypothetical protein
MVNLRRVAAIAGVVLVAGSACTKATSTAARTEPASSASASVPTLPVASSAAPRTPTSASAVASAKPAITDPEDAKAWTDDIVVKRLAKDCKWKPTRDLNDTEYEQYVSPLACTISAVQSCAPDPCWNTLTMECQPACKKTCTTCGDGCATKCEACKRPCKDDECRLACAGECAKCNEACVKEADRCRTGKCATAMRACHTKLADEFDRAGCESECGKVQECATDCAQKPDGNLFACGEQCAKKHMKRCPLKFDTNCTMGYRFHRE